MDKKCACCQKDLGGLQHTVLGRDWDDVGELFYVCQPCWEEKLFPAIKEMLTSGGGGSWRTRPSML